MFSLHTWPGTPNLNTVQNLVFNQNTILNNTNSYNINSGALIIKGGIGINKNTFIGENLNVLGNINISKSVFIKENITTHNLLVEGKSQFLGNMTMNNNIAGEFYVLDKYNKTFNVDGNGIYGNMMIHSNVDVSGNINISKSLFVKENITTHNLLVEGKSQFLGNMTMNNNIAGEFYILDKYNKTFNVDGNGIYGNMMIHANVDVSGNINISKSLFIKENITTHNLLVEGKSQFLGNMTMNNNIAGEFYVLDKYNKTFNVDGNGIYGNMMVHSNVDVSGNINISKSLFIKENITTHNLLVEGKSQFLGNMDVLNNINVSESIYVQKNITTHNLLVEGKSQFLGNMTMNNNIDGEFYVLDKYNKTFNVDGNGIYGNMMIHSNVDVSGNINISKSLFVKENITTHNLLVEGKSQFLGNMTMNNNIAGEFYVLDKYNKTFNVDGNGIYGNMMIHSNMDVVGNLNLSGAIDIKNKVIATELVIKENSTFLGNMTMNSNILGEFYTLDKNKKLLMWKATAYI